MNSYNFFIQVILPCIIAFIILYQMDYFSFAKYGGGILPYAVVLALLVLYFSYKPFFGMLSLESTIFCWILITIGVYYLFGVFNEGHLYYADVLLRESIKISAIIAISFIIINIIGGSENYLEIISKGLGLNILLINFAFLGVLH